MIAAETDLSAQDLPDDFEGFLGHVERAVPAGVGKGHRFATDWDRERQTRKVPAMPARAHSRASRSPR